MKLYFVIIWCIKDTCGPGSNSVKQFEQVDWKKFFSWKLFIKKYKKFGLHKINLIKNHKNVSLVLTIRSSKCSAPSVNLSDMPALYKQANRSSISYAKLVGLKPYQFDVVLRVQNTISACKSQTAFYYRFKF